MIFDEFGYPKVNGASDYVDSSHLAGILAITNHPKQVTCLGYCTGRKYIRHPRETRYDFSRDQAILLIAGLIKQSYNSEVNLDFITGKDILPPSVRGMETIAYTGSATWFQKMWFKLEIYWHSLIQPLEEPFQIIAMCETYGVEYLRLWTSKNKLWKWSIRRYLCELDGAWRDEKELADHVIKYIESKI